MTTDGSYITLNERLSELTKLFQGFNFTCEQLIEYTQNPDSHFHIVYGCIKSLSYGIDYSSGHEATNQVPELQQVSLRISNKDEIKITSKTNVKGSEFRIATNVNAYERIIKNAADFGHEVCALIEDDKLIICTLLSFQCRPEDMGIVALSKDGSHSPPF